MTNPQDSSGFSQRENFRELRFRVHPDADVSIDNQDERIISELLIYKTNIKEEIAEKAAQEERKRMEQSMGPDGSDLASFLYDRLDDIEEVLDEEEYNQLESMIMECK